MVRAFLDANVLFSAAYHEDAGLRRLWKTPRIELVTSRYAAEEARRNLDEPTQLHDLDVLLAEVEIWEAAPAERSFSPPIKLPEQDRPILLAAIQAHATHLLTGDFKYFGPFYGQTVEGVLILPPSEFLRRIA